MLRTVRNIGKCSLAKQTLNGNGTVVTKKTVSSAFNSSRSEDFPCTIDPDPTVFMQWRTQPGALYASVNLLQQHPLVPASSELLVVAV